MPEDECCGATAGLGVFGVEAVSERFDGRGAGVVGESGCPRAEETRVVCEDRADARMFDPLCEVGEREVVGACDLGGGHAGEVRVQEAGERLGPRCCKFWRVGEHVVSMTRTWKSARRNARRRHVLRAPVVGASRW